MANESRDSYSKCGLGGRGKKCGLTTLLSCNGFNQKCGKMGLNRHSLKGYGPGGDLQDGGGVRRGDHLPPHKYIRNTSTCGTTPTEHLLNAGRRPQTSQKMPEGNLHAEAGPYPKLNPRSCANREEKGKSLPAASGAAD